MSLTSLQAHPAAVWGLATTTASCLTVEACLESQVVLQVLKQSGNLLLLDEPT